jgi:hypothetical protein
MEESLDLVNSKRTFFHNMELFYKYVEIFSGEQSWIFVLPGNNFAVYLQLAIGGMDNKAILTGKTGIKSSYFRTDFRKSERQFVEDENGKIHDLKLHELPLSLKLCFCKIKLHRVTLT